MKVFSITVDASPKYPMPRTYQVEATSFSTAIARAVKMYWKDRPFCGSRPNRCKVCATYIQKLLKEEAQ